MDKKFGLIGENLKHTYSPFIHERLLNKLNIKGQYGVYEVKRTNLKYVVSGLKALGFSGVNVTIPYKVDIIDYLDLLNEEAAKIGAVNVIKISEDNSAIGYNTDYYGFGMMLRKYNIEIKDKNILILGTGGASRAVVQYLKDNFAGNITIVSRNIETAKLKYKGYDVIEYQDISEVTDCSIIINTTPVGMYPDVDESAIETKFLKNFKYAIDLVYNPTKTLFLKEAEKEGLITLNGLYMLVAQAVKSQEIWNEINIKENILDSVVRELHIEIDKG
ncbi:shikimate dehydrogenase [Soehngenia longivitae]|uniref:Shikimate dehydrogenase (NADP(+)) n=1 Tax=Soehngenia longivitae TaxID=2562294 RepID=A0A4Z0D4F4_9FIRM|nr:shikimate dehydrogenase [Soehngenia longivitae]TFZ39219.1 shikimate dehydrogenase [Soehngenia longivitae]